MAYTTYSSIRLLTNISTNDISNSDITSIIAESTKELNRLINVKEIREPVDYLDSTRKNSIDGSNTTFYVKNWKGKYLADMDNDGDVDTSDIIVYQVASDGTETTLTVSSITHNEGKFVLSSAPSSGVSLYVTYEWCYKDVSTPDNLISLACAYLTAAYCYAKLNIGRSPQFSVGNKRIYRHLESFDHYYQRAMNIVNQINDSMYDSTNSITTF